LDITAVVANYKTPALLDTCVRTLKKHYGEFDIIVIDNGSEDESVGLVSKLVEELGVLPVLNGVNIGHGPAMHQGIQMCRTKYVFLFDSDCEVTKGGFLEKMQTTLEKKQGYAIGWLRYVNTNGVSAAGKFDKSKFIPYVHPSAALIDREIYYTLPPFLHEGAPCTRNMWIAQGRGLKVFDFPIRDYVKHWEAGTRRRFRGKWNPRAEETPVPWKATKTYPI